MTSLFKEKMMSAFGIRLLFSFSFVRFVQGSADSCVHGGILYRDGDYFPPNKSFLKTEGPLQCVQCRCSRGLVVCEVENCTFLQCENPIKHSQFCCLQCSGASKSSEKNYRDFIAGERMGVLAGPAECFSQGRNYEHGSEWRAAIGPQGAPPCLRCRCRNGNVVCSRLPCNRQPCAEPRRKFDECCPVCPFPDGKNEYQALCLPKSSEMFVFKTPDVRNDSDKIEYAFVKNVTDNGSVSLYTWNLKSDPSSTPLTVKILPREEVKRINLRLLGSVSYRRYKKYSQKGEKLQSKCPVQCWKKIRRLENSLGIHRVSPKSQCSESEMDLAGDVRLALGFPRNISIIV